MRCRVFGDLVMLFAVVVAGFVSTEVDARCSLPEWAGGFLAAEPASDAGGELGRVHGLSFVPGKRGFKTLMARLYGTPRWMTA